MQARSTVVRQADCSGTASVHGSSFGKQEAQIQVQTETPTAAVHVSSAGFAAMNAPHPSKVDLAFNFLEIWPTVSADEEEDSTG